MDPTPRTGEQGLLEYDVHDLLLLAVHQEFMEFGLKLSDNQELTACLAQSATGAFPSMRYNDADGGRVVVVHALAMFDNLIVSAIASSGATEEPQLREEDFENRRRRIVLSANVWPAAAEAAAAEGTGEGKGQKMPQVMTEGLILLFFFPGPSPAP